MLDLVWFSLVRKKILIFYYAIYAIVDWIAVTWKKQKKTKK